MSYENNKNNGQKLSDINVDHIISMVFKTISTVFLVALVLWLYFSVYNPKERNYIKNTRYAYKLIEQEAKEIYRRDGFIFEENETVDKLCVALANKYSNGNGQCQVSKRAAILPNFKIGKTKVTIYGMNMQPYHGNGTLVKDIIIDVNGEKGENTFGIDRTPVSIYSHGRMGGMLSPANCRAEDVTRYGMRYSHVCPAGVELNFYDSKRPLAYNIMQVGGKNGSSRYVGRNVSFLRADCAAFGSELIGMEEFCEQRGYHWLTACY
ncbi:MAG: hypothetical protein IKL52_04050, partial [Candidatus Gastranaerophilales bacterium]|nr:hypothetical protein [Candidatus Gastranaerophilales bacterium]